MQSHTLLFKAVTARATVGGKSARHIMPLLQHQEAGRRRTQKGRDEGGGMKDENRLNDGFN